MNRPLILLSAAVCSLGVSAAGHHILSPQTQLALQAVSRADNDRVVPVYITIDPSVIDRDVLMSLDVNVGLDLGSTLTARVPLGNINALCGVPGVNYIQVASTARQMLDVARDEMGMGYVHQGLTLSQPYLGAGVVVGIVDSGFDYAHAAYRDADGNLRIKRVWEQATEPFGSLSSPGRFGYGVEMADASEIIAAGADRQNNSHGSHVTSIAAGSDHCNDGVLVGMAPYADIVLVSMQDAGINNVCISDAIAYIFDYADQVDKPCVVNLSLGGNSGPHDGTSTFDRIADALQGPGRLIVGASGNNRADKFHVRHQFDAAGESPILTFVDYRMSQSFHNDGEIEIWGGADADFEVYLLAYKLSSNDVAERVKVYPAEDEAVSTVSLGRNIAGNFAVASEVSPLNGKAHVALTSRITSIRTGYAVGIEVVPLSPGVVDIWADDLFLALSSRDVPGAVGPTDESTLCEIGGTASRILTVGAYATRVEYTRFGESQAQALDETVGDICSFSSAGPTADGRMKPQVTAPGCYISAAVSSYDRSGTTVYSWYHDGNGHDNYYGFMQGTSMATPFVTGTVATWLQAWPEMTPEDLADVVRVSARKDQYTGDALDNDWGYGKIDALAGIRECIARAGNGSIGSITADGSVPVITEIGDGSVRLTFSSAIADASLSLYSMMGTEVVHADLGAVDVADTRTLDTRSLPAGIYILAVNTPNGCQSVKITISKN